MLEIPSFYTEVEVLCFGGLQEWLRWERHYEEELCDIADYLDLESCRKSSLGSVRAKTKFGGCGTGMFSEQTRIGDC